jgi:predicted nicotinamide N-methyase
MTREEVFILAHTTPCRPPACPEISLHLASEITPLWHATEQFLDRHNLAPPFWAFPWVGGQALARHLLDHPDLVAGRSVLDFAAGCGIVAIAAARAGATAVTACEIDAMALTAILLNAAANDASVIVTDEDVLGREDCPWQVILAGDVCYERPMADKVFAWMRRCAARGAMILLADPGRAYMPKTGLMRLATMSVACSLELEDRESREVGIYQVVG